MADPNQTPQRGEWACPCAGCQKAVAWERKQLIQIINEMKKNAFSDLPYELIIEMIESRNPQKKKP